MAALDTAAQAHQSEANPSMARRASTATAIKSTTPKMATWRYP
jgi:hypothetical protein